jgi:poly(hydroxyalkanoate) depolymerase family esterase
MMSNPLNDDMIRAARLTQAGRLEEATALLQKMAQAGASTSANRAALELAAKALEGVTGRKMPEVNAAFESGIKDSPHTSSNSARANSSAPLRGIFERLRLGDALEALQGLRKGVPPAPEVRPGVGRFVSKSFSNEAGSRGYKLYIPSRHDGRPRPLIVMLHGCAQAPDDFAAATRMNFVAEEHCCFVAYPEQTSAANASRCWNWFKVGDQKRGHGEPALIAGIARQVMVNHRIDPRRVYVAGLSAGGAAAAIAGEAYPDIFAAVGVHSGLACGVARDMPSAFAAMQGRHQTQTNGADRPVRTFIQMPTIVFHGDRDTTVHPRNGGEVIERARAGGEFQTVIEQGEAAGHAYTRSILQDASGRGLLEQWVVHGAGHAWSGGSTSGSFADPRGPDATKEMMRFFLEHPRNDRN